MYVIISRDGRLSRLIIRDIDAPQHNGEKTESFAIGTEKKTESY